MYLKVKRALSGGKKYKKENNENNENQIVKDMQQQIDYLENKIKTLERTTTSSSGKSIQTEVISHRSLSISCSNIY